MYDRKHYEFVGTIGSGFGAVASGLCVAFAGASLGTVALGAFAGAVIGSVSAAAIAAGIDYVEDIVPGEYQGRNFDVASLIGMAAVPVIAATSAYNLVI